MILILNLGFVLNIKVFGLFPIIPKIRLKFLTLFLELTSGKLNHEKSCKQDYISIYLIELFAI